MHRFCLSMRCSRLKPGSYLYLEFEFQKLLDTFKQFIFVFTHQRNRVSFGAGAPGAPDAMDVVFWCSGQFEIDHMRQILDVESTCSNVGGYQCTYRALFEFRQRLSALRLTFVAMD